MKELKNKTGMIRLRMQKYMERVNGDESAGKYYASETITEESENEIDVSSAASGASNWN